MQIECEGISQGQEFRYRKLLPMTEPSVAICDVPAHAFRCQISEMVGDHGKVAYTTAVLIPALDLSLAEEYVMPKDQETCRNSDNVVVNGLSILLGILGLLQ